MKRSVRRREKEKKREGRTRRVTWARSQMTEVTTDQVSVVSQFDYDSRQVGRQCNGSVANWICADRRITTGCHPCKWIVVWFRDSCGKRNQKQQNEIGLWIWVSTDIRLRLFVYPFVVGFFIYFVLLCGQDNRLKVAPKSRKNKVRKREEEKKKSKIATKSSTTTTEKRRGQTGKKKRTHW